MTNLNPVDAMTNPDYRALCADLLADYDNRHYRSELSDRARASAGPASGGRADGCCGLGSCRRSRHHSVR
jgi:hypothetical protein